MNAFEQKQANRAERLLARAEKYRAIAASRHEEANRLAYVMNGQPILVGHHSEKRHRRDLARMDRYTRHAFQLSKLADEAVRRAKAIGSGGVSSDDPNAINKLQRKLDLLNVQQAGDKAVNAYWRKHGTMKGYPGVTDEQADRVARSIEEAYSWEKQPVPKWTLSNRGAEIRRLTKRIAELGTMEARVSTERTVGDVRIVEDVEANRLYLFFPGKPVDARRTMLKRAGFRWTPSVGAWGRMLNDSARFAADIALRDNFLVLDKLGSND